MAHGSALKYVGNKQKIFPGVKLGDHTAAEVEALPEEWNGDVLVASGEFEWASKEKVADKPVHKPPPPAEGRAEDKPADGDAK